MHAFIKIYWKAVPAYELDAQETIEMTGCSHTSVNRDTKRPKVTLAIQQLGAGTTTQPPVMNEPGAASRCIPTRITQATDAPGRSGPKSKSRAAKRPRALKSHTFRPALDQEMKRLARRNVTQRDIVRITGIRLSLLRAWRRGDRMPNKASFIKLYRLARLGKQPIEYFVARACHDQGWEVPEPPTSLEGVML